MVAAAVALSVTSVAAASSAAPRRQRRLAARPAAAGRPAVAVVRFRPRAPVGRRPGAGALAAPSAARHLVRRYVVGWPATTEA